MSYITVELDALNQIPHVATAAGIRPCEVTHGLNFLWAHCFRQKLETVTSVHLVGFFGSDDADRVGRALAAFGFLEKLEGGMWRVRGSGKYLRVREGRVEAGKKGRAKQLQDSHASHSAGSPRAKPGSQEPTGARADSGQNRALESPPEPEPKRALKSPPEPGQKRALSPNTEISPPTGEREISVSVRSTRAPESRPPPDGGGSGSQVAELSSRPEKPPRPKLIPGTPEYREAERDGDWVALGWVKS